MEGELRRGRFACRQTCGIFLSLGMTIEMAEAFASARKSPCVGRIGRGGAARGERLRPCLCVAAPPGTGRPSVSRGIWLDEARFPEPALHKGWGNLASAEDKSLCRAGVRTECGGHVLPAASFVRAEGKHCFLLFSMVAQESAFRPAYAPKQLGEHIRRRSQRDTSTLTACMAGNIPSFFLFSQDRCRRCSRKGRGISTMSAFNLSCGGGQRPGIPRPGIVRDEDVSPSGGVCRAGNEGKVYGTGQRGISSAGNGGKGKVGKVWDMLPHEGKGCCLCEEKLCLRALLLKMCSSLFLARTRFRASGLLRKSARRSVWYGGMCF